MKPFFLKTLEHLTGLHVETQLRNGRTVRGLLVSIYTRPRENGGGYEPAGITLQRNIPVEELLTLNEAPSDTGVPP